MGSISTRAGTVAVRTGSLAAPLSGITDTCPNLSPQHPTDHRIQIRGEIRLACVRGRSVSTHHKKATARKAVKVPAHQLTKAPLHPVPGHRRSDCPADHESNPGWLGVTESVGPHQQVAHDGGPADPGPGTHGQRELAAMPHPGLGRQDQALSRSRPLRLRAARTARPARVRMRSRKPCVFARRRLFGWNVRLLTGTPGKGILPTRTQDGVRFSDSHRLPSGTPPFARRVALPRLRLWKAILPELTPHGVPWGTTCTTCG